MDNNGPKGTNLTTCVRFSSTVAVAPTVGAYVTFRSRRARTAFMVKLHFGLVLVPYTPKTCMFYAMLPEAKLPN